MIPDQARDGRFTERAALLAGQAGCAFGWTPEIFWSATPAELAAMLGAVMGEDVAPPDRDKIAALMEAFPDG